MIQLDTGQYVYSVLSQAYVAMNMLKLKVTCDQLVTSQANLRF